MKNNYIKGLDGSIRAVLNFRVFKIISKPLQTSCSSTSAALFLFAAPSFSFYLEHLVMLGGRMSEDPTRRRGSSWKALGPESASEFFAAVKNVKTFKDDIHNKTFHTIPGGNSSAGHHGIVVEVWDSSNMTSEGSAGQQESINEKRDDSHATPEKTKSLALKLSWNHQVLAFEYEREVSLLKRLTEEDPPPPFLLRYYANFWVTVGGTPYPVLVSSPFCRMTLEDRVGRMRDCLENCMFCSRKEQNQYNMGTAMKWGMQICQAMRALDDRSILHGDLALRYFFYVILFLPSNKYIFQKEV